MKTLSVGLAVRLRFDAFVSPEGYVVAPWLRPATVGEPVAVSKGNKGRVVSVHPVRDGTPHLGILYALVEFDGVPAKYSVAAYDLEAIEAVQRSV